MQDNEKITPPAIDFEAALTTFDHTFPRDAVLNAISNQEVSTPILLGYLEYAIENVETLDHSYMGHIFALFILSQFREKQAFPLIIKLAKLPYKQQSDLLGDSLTESLSQFIGSTFDGDLDAIKSIIQDKLSKLYTRLATIQSLLVLLNDNLIEESLIETYTHHLFEILLTAKDHEGMTALVYFWCDYDPSIFIKKIQVAFDSGLVDEGWISLDYIRNKIAQNDIKKYVSNSKHRPIKDAVKEMEWWACFNNGSSKFDEATPYLLDEHYHYEHDNCCGFNTKIMRKEPKIGRNDPCHCGSGKKYKKCCL
jgi:uncharacterized protein YchJ